MEGKIGKIQLFFIFKILRNVFFYQEFAITSGTAVCDPRADHDWPDISPASSDSRENAPLSSPLAMERGAAGGLHVIQLYSSTE